MAVKLADRKITGPMAWRSTADSSSACTWRSQRPLLNLEKCTGCMICWKYCPEPAIHPDSGKVRLDLVHCKGCGVCAYECPVDAIRMEQEAL